MSLAALVLVGQVFAFESSASAALPTCNAVHGFYFDGFYTDPTPQLNIEGASAKIRIQTAALCNINTYIGNTSSSWSMITEGEGHSSGRGVPGGLAQVGMWNTSTNPYTDLQYFYEGAADNAGSPVGWHAQQVGGIDHRYWVQWIASGSCPGGTGGCFSYNVDTTRLALSSFNPYAYWGNPSVLGQEWNLQFFGEVHNVSTDIQGNNTGHATVWFSAQAQDSSTDNFRNYTCNLTSAVDNARYGLNYPANRGCGTWSTYTY